MACGTDKYEAVRLAGYPTDKSGFRSNARRLCLREEIRERVAEFQERAIEMVSVYHAWSLLELRRIAETNVAAFLQRNPDGIIFVDDKGDPVIDLRRVSDAQLAGVKKLTVTNDGFKIALDDRLAAHKLIAEASGLLGKRQQEPPPRAIAVSEPVSKAQFELGRVDLDKLSEEQLQTIQSILGSALVKDDE